MALDRYGNSKGMSDALDDDLITILIEMGAESLRKEKNDRWIEQTKKHSQKPINEITTGEFLKIINEWIADEIPTSRNKDGLLIEVDEEVNRIILEFGVKGFKSFLGRVYHEKDKTHNYPILETNCKSGVDNFHEHFFKNPELIAKIPEEMKINKWGIHVIALIYDSKLDDVSKKIKQTEKKLENLCEEEQILRNEYATLMEDQD